LPNTHYETLGVSENANAKEIKAAYRKLARRLHPDVNRSADAADLMSSVNEAYEVLKTPESRATYDALRRTGVRHAAPPPKPADSPGVRHLISVVDVPSPIYCLGFSPNGANIAMGCFDNVLRYVSAKTGNRLAEVRLEGGAVSHLRWATNRRVTAVGSSDRSVTVWQVNDREVSKMRVKRAEWVSQALAGPPGTVYFGSVHRSVTCFNSNSGTIVFSRKLHTDSVTSLALGADDTLLASGGNDQRVILWDARTGRETAVIGPLRAPVARLAVSGTGSQLAVALVDHGIRIFDLQSGSLRHTLWGHEGPVEALSYHPEGRLLASIGRDASVRLWNATTGEPVANLGGHSGPVEAVAFSHGGDLMAAGSIDRVLTLWRIDSP
jgi:WD40 repeat protein